MITYLLAHRYRFEQNVTDSTGDQDGYWYYSPAPQYSGVIYAEGSYSAGKFNDFYYIRIPKEAVTGLSKGKITLHAYIDNQSITYASMFVTWHQSSGNWGYFGIGVDRKVYFNLDGISSNTDEVLDLDTWNELSFRWDGTNAFIDIDGVEKKSFACKKDFTSVDRDLYVGRYGALTSFNVDGYIDDLRIYKDELLSVQVNANLKQRTSNILLANRTMTATVKRKESDISLTDITIDAILKRRDGLATIEN